MQITETNCSEIIKHCSSSKSEPFLPKLKACTNGTANFGSFDMSQVPCMQKTGDQMNNLSLIREVTKPILHISRVGLTDSGATKMRYAR
mgnify:FL=1|jgi:hypothetical protein